MICKKCGKEVEEGVLFCSSCGEKVIVQGTSGNNGVDSMKEVTSKKKRKINPLVVTLLVIVFLVAVVVGVCILSEGVKTSINVEEYVSVEYNGYDGYGAASWTFDKEEFFNDYEEEYTLPSSFKKKLKEDMSIYKLLTSYCSYLDLELEDLDDEEALELLYYTLFENAKLSKDRGLQNGDDLTLIWNITEELKEEQISRLYDLFGVEINYGKEGYSVSGLKEVPEFDPFEGVELSFIGAAPCGKALLTNYPDNGWIYTLNGPEMVTNGDEVTVSIYSNGYTMEEYIAQYGKVPNSMEKSYKVSGLPEYISSASQIPEETLAEMQVQAEDIIKGITYDWTSGFTLDISYIGNYVLTAKETVSTPQNMISLIYKMHYTNSFIDYAGVAQEYTTDIYYYVTWYDLTIEEDGAFIYDKNSYSKAQDKFTVNTNIFMRFYSWYGQPTSEYSLTFPGYATLDEVYNQCVTQYIERYKLEENIMK